MFGVRATAGRLLKHSSIPHLGLDLGVGVGAPPTTPSCRFGSGCDSLPCGFGCVSGSPPSSPQWVWVWGEGGWVGGVPPPVSLGVYAGLTTWGAGVGVIAPPPMGLSSGVGASLCRFGCGCGPRPNGFGYALADGCGRGTPLLYHN